MFAKRTAESYQTPPAGIRPKTLAYGERTLLTEFRLERGRNRPDHAHPYEQTGCPVAGHIVFRMGETEYDTKPGDSWSVPMNVIHGAKVLEDSVAIKVFSPVREDHLPPEEREKRRA